LSRPLAACLIVLLPLLAAACGTGGVASSGASDISNGKTLFSQKCGACHTLKAAGTNGQIGPSLDASFGPARHQGFKSSTIREIVRDQVKYPSRNSGMPANLVTGTDQDDVAAFVAKCAGNTGDAACAASQGGGGGAGNDGKTIFTSNCASCHTLADAQATGNIGPNLDQVKPSLARAKTQVIHGGGAMPAFKGKLTDEQIDAVAKYVSSVAGK
jgi:cbb3-type cytochrome c oxidase subunit III